MRETQSLQIVAQKNAKGTLDKTQQNNKYRLWGDRDEPINCLTSECSKIAHKEYKTRHEWVGKVIQWELSKKVTFDHANKWYTQNQESAVENETHKLL